MLFDMPDLTADDAAVLARIRALQQELRVQTADRRQWAGLVRKLAYARAIQSSNSIEGFNVSLEDALAAADRDEPLEAEGVAWRAVFGYRDAMTYVLQSADDPHVDLTVSLLLSLHFMLQGYDLEQRPGRFRVGPVYVVDEAAGDVVYEGPPARLVPDLVRELVDHLASDTSPPLVRAAMAHLNLVMIHPFKDGNGRLARVLQSLVLTREGLLAAELCSIEEYLGRHTQDYYRVLAVVGAGRWQPERDAHPWVKFCLTAHFRQARRHLVRIEEAGRLWHLVEMTLQRRGLAERAVEPLCFAAPGRRLRNSSYRSMVDVEQRQATADLALLVKSGLLVAHGAKRGRYYAPSDELRQLRMDAHQGIDLDVGEDPYANVQPSLLA